MESRPALGSADTVSQAVDVACVSFLKPPDSFRCLHAGLAAVLFIYFYGVLRIGEDLKVVGISSMQMANLFSGSHHDNRNEDADSGNDGRFMLENA